MLSPVRVGTWNLDGKWSDEHRDFLTRQNCDIWLLTEVHPDAQLTDYKRADTNASTPKGGTWSAILSRLHIEKNDTPHPATAEAVIDDTTYWSSVLPWRTCGNQPPWAGSTHGDKMAAVLQQLEEAAPRAPLVWGGDWNQALIGRDYAGSTDGRQHLLATTGRLQLQVPTAGLRHQLPGHASIDHIAIPQDYLATRVEHVPAKHRNINLSDHDAYVLEFDRPPTT